jgi:hypothetical protein
MPTERVAQSRAANKLLQTVRLMKKIAAIALGLCLLGMVAVQADDKEKAKPTAEQKKLHKEMTEKYDTNKDGKLDKEERAKISEDDKKKMKDAGMTHGKKDGEKKKSDK